MQKLTFCLASLSLFAVPLQANAAQYQNGDVRMGAFVGARFQIQLGGRESSRPRAALTLAPTLNRTSGNGINRTIIGEGVALNFGPGSRPALTLAGVRADTALALHRNGNVDSEKRLGISSGGWVAIGLGVVAIGGGLYFLHLVDEANDHSE
jgi:hypothetical protein